MGSNTLYDNYLDELIKKVTDKEKVVKYHEKNEKISKRILYEPFIVLKSYLPEHMRDIVFDQQLRVFTIPFIKQKVIINADKKRIIFKGRGYKEENKRSMAFFAGSLFSITPLEEAKSFELTDDNKGMVESIRFILSENDIDYKYFFGFLFEYLYLLEMQKKEQREIEQEPKNKDVKQLCISEEFEKEAYNQFVRKYLHEFTHLLEQYNKKESNIIRDLAVYNHNDSSSVETTDDFNIENMKYVSFALNTQSILATFNTVLQIINLGMTKEDYRTFFECYAMGMFPQNDTVAESRKNRYALISQEYSKRGELAGREQDYPAASFTHKKIAHEDEKHCLFN